jgi:hypothetical protein
VWQVVMSDKSGSRCQLGFSADYPRSTCLLGCLARCLMMANEAPGKGGWCLTSRHLPSLLVSVPLMAQCDVCQCF